MESEHLTLIIERFREEVLKAIDSLGIKIDKIEEKSNINSNSLVKLEERMFHLAKELEEEKGKNKQAVIEQTEKNGVFVDGITKASKFDIKQAWPYLALGSAAGGGSSGLVELFKKLMGAG